MVAALKRHRNEPVMHLGDTTLTGGETAERISQYVQAFESLDAGTGVAGALLALNRPEVLFILGAGQTQGFRRTSLHPLGSADDHAYVINDAGISVLIIDPYFTERALALLEKCPGLTKVLTIGPVPDELADVGTDLVAAAAGFDPRPLDREAAAARPHRVDHLHRRHHRQAQGRRSAPSRAMNTMTQIQMAEWEWPEPPPVPHVHAALARRRRVLRAHGDQGRLAVRAGAVRPGRGARGPSRSRRSPPRCWCRRCSTP